MYTVEEIQNADFDRVMRGYRPEDVQMMLSQVAAQLETAIKEKNDMEKKLYILAQKVEEYRSEEDMLKTAMLNAQRMGESVIREAKQKADSIVREADLKANLLDEQAKDKTVKAEREYMELQHKVSQFKSEVLDIYRQHIESLSSLPVDKDIIEDDDDKKIQDITLVELAMEPIEEIPAEPELVEIIEEDIIEVIQETDDEQDEVEEEPVVFIKSQSQSFDDKKDDTFDFGKASDDIAADVKRTSQNIDEDIEQDTQLYNAMKKVPNKSADKEPVAPAQGGAGSIFSQYDKIDFND